MELNDRSYMMQVAEQFLNTVGRSCADIIRLEQGLINRSFRVTDDQGGYHLMQRINTDVFSDPAVIQEHIMMTAGSMQRGGYPYHILVPYQLSDGNTLLTDQVGHVWRMLNWISGSVSFQRIDDPETASRAASVLAHFHQAAGTVDPGALKESIPGFTALRKRREVLESCDLAEMDAKSKVVLEQIRELYPVMEVFLSIYEAAPIQVIHGDPKISNFLFDRQGQPLALVDWDTIMPGPRLYDLGDMIRSFTNAGREDDAVRKDQFNADIFHAVYAGYSSVIPDLNKGLLLQAGMTVSLVQGMRFLTDHLQGNRYYQVDHPTHNLVRAENQVSLARAIYELSEG